MARVVVAPDSFKGSCDARTGAQALAQGWLSQRPGDDIILLPLADGGEGTMEVVAGSVPGSRVVDVGAVRGPLDSPVRGRYLLLPDRTAVVELAVASGLHLAVPPKPLHASTFGTGQIIDAAMRAGAQRVVLTLGGSATTDGGCGLLHALGLVVVDRAGRAVASGGAGILQAHRVDSGALLTPPTGGVEVLVDVTSPLLGPRGAAAVFAPQKGAGADDVALLERALTRWAELSGGDPQAAGAGAAGGTAYGVATWWQGRIASGAEHVARLVGLDSAIADADVLVTGEGRFDATSLDGKAVGAALRLAARHAVAVHVVCGQADASLPFNGTQSPQLLVLAGLAGSAEASMADAPRWLRQAGAQLARARGRG